MLFTYMYNRAGSPGLSQVLASNLGLIPPCEGEIRLWLPLLLYYYIGKVVCLFTLSFILLYFFFVVIVSHLFFYLLLIYARKDI